MKKRTGAAAGLLLLSTLLLGAAAADAQDVERGRGLAAIHCSSCHVTGRDGRRGQTVARAFGTIANAYELDAGRLRGWIAAPHPPMPDPQLRDDEIRDLAAYIMSLRRP